MTDAGSAHNKTLTRIVNHIGLSDAEIEQRKNYLEFTAHDAELLTELHARHEDHVTDIADVFYDHLLKFPPLRQMLSDPATLAQLKKSQSHYFDTLTSGNYDGQYVAERLRIGVVHQRIGLDPKWYIGGYRKYISLLLPIIHELYGETPKAMLEAYDALIKVVCFDMSLALETYFEADRRETIRHKEYAEKIITGLPTGLIVLDESLSIRSINPAMQSLLQVDESTVIGVPFLDVIADETLSERANDVLRTGEAVLGVLVSSNENGSMRHLDFRITRVQLDENLYLLMIAKDVTERVKARMELRDSEERFRLTFSLAGVGLAHLSKEGKILRANRRLREILGYSDKDLKNLDYRSITHPEDREKDTELLAKVLRNEIKSYSHEKRYLHKDGRYVWSHFTLSLVRTDTGEPRYFIVVLEDVSERKQTAEKLVQLAQYDSLTTLPNRVLLQDRLLQATTVAARKNQQMAVLFLDLDRFKDVNDSLGHEAGDIMLQQISQRLSQQLRESDTVARIGGDEFVILLQDIVKAEQVATVATKILAAVAKPITIERVEFLPTCSIGISLYPKDGTDSQTLLRNADTAMYRAKEGGKNTFEFYSQGMNETILNRLNIESGLRRAIERNEFVLHYQPQIDVNTGQIVGVEALLRWQPLASQMISPDQFISIAEETGLIIPIGEWVLREACRQAKSWVDEGFPSVSVSVNVSSRQFRTDIAATVAAVLKETGCVPEHLTLELTESVLMDSPEAMHETLHKLKQIGVKLAIDDFGTGYSSLSYLRRFPIDSLKIDRAFVSDIVIDADNAAIVKAIIALGNAMNLDVIAEGVETSTQIDMLKVEDCVLMQGYFFSKPVAADTLLEMLREALPLGLEICQ